MAQQTAYFVQAFDAGKGGHLKPDSPIACKSASGALRTAERLALSKFAVVAYSSTGDVKRHPELPPHIASDKNVTEGLFLDPACHESKQAAREARPP